MKAMLAHPRQYCPTAAVDRRFGLLLLLSFCLHGAIFMVIWQARQPRVPATLPTLIASIRLVAATSTAIPPAEASSAPRAATLPPKARRPMTHEEQRSAPLAPIAAGPAIARSAMPATTPAAAPAESAPTKPALATPGASDNAADALAGYRRQLVELLARQHSYPRIAALRGWEGEVRLRLKVARKGNLLDIQLDHSSGFEVLDRDALALLEGYGSLPPLPEALDSGEISVVVPISYKLRKTT